MRPKSSSSTFIWRKSMAFTVPSVISSSNVSPVRLSVTVRVSSAKVFSNVFDASPNGGARSRWGLGVWACLFFQVSHRAQLVEAGFHLVALELGHSLRAELLDVERGEDGAVRHRPAEVVLSRRGVEAVEISEKAAGEAVACAGRVDD